MNAPGGARPRLAGFGSLYSAIFFRAPLLPACAMPSHPFLYPTLLLAALLAVAMPAQAANVLCKTHAMRGNKWICTEEPGVCTFAFTVDEKNRKITRRADERNTRIPIVIDKWTDKVIIAHEDQVRVDSRFIEQYFYKIELDTGNFLMANEYRTNSGRYLSQEELNLSDKKRFSYYRPLLFSEKGKCRFRSAR